MEPDCPPLVNHPPNGLYASPSTGYGYHRPPSCHNLPRFHRPTCPRTQGTCIGSRLPAQHASRCVLSGLHVGPRFIGFPSGPPSGSLLPGPQACRRWGAVPAPDRRGATLRDGRSAIIMGTAAGYRTSRLPRAHTIHRTESSFPGTWSDRPQCTSNWSSWEARRTRAASP